MKIKKLRNKNSKKYFLCGLICVVVLTITVTFIGSKANFRMTASIPLTEGKVTASPYDINIVAIYLDGVEQSKDTLIPNGYKINEETSYCYKGTNKENKDANAKLYTDELDNHVFSGISKSSKCILYLDKINDSCGNACQYILSNINNINIRRNDYLPFNDIVTSSNAPTEKTLYKAYDDDGTTYYYAGSPIDNWVLFGGYYWRIIRINGDGTIRMIYQGKEENGPQITGTGLQIGSIPFNELYEGKEYVGYWYKENNEYKPSTIYTYLNNWFNNSSLMNSNYFSKIDTNAGFCGDRTISSANSSIIYYNPFNRYINKAPIYKCNEITDLYTYKGADKGNKLLDNPVGLITADEVKYAGLSPVNGDNFLKVNLHYWTMSPYFYNSKKAVVFRVVSSGFLDGGDTSDNGVARPFGARPVINIRSDVTLSGDGTASNPYKIS